MSQAVKKLLCWSLGFWLVACGENKVGVTPVPPRTQARTDSAPAAKLEPTTASIQANIVDRYCIRCHNGRRAARRVNLEDLQAVVDGKMVLPPPATPPAPGSHQHAPPVPIVKGCLRSSPFYTQMRDGKMPPPKPNVHRITPDELKVVEKWILSLGPICGPDLDDPDPDGQLDPDAGGGSGKP